MSYAKQLLDAHPGSVTADASVLAATIDALSDCAQACTADADNDLREQNLAEMVTCIRLCWDCADVCTATLGVVTRQAARDANVTRPLLQACIAICKSCGDECQRHAHHHEHCRVCEQACRRCEQACRELLGTLPGALVALTVEAAVVTRCHWPAPARLPNGATATDRSSRARHS